MATGIITTTAKPGGPVGIIAQGTATQLQGNNAATVRVVASEAMPFPLSGSAGSLALGLVVATNASTPAAPAGDSCWGALEAGFYGGDGVTLRYLAICAPRGLDGTIAADNVVVTQCVFAPHLVNAGAQMTPNVIFGTTSATLSITQGVTNAPPMFMIPDAIRVVFFVQHVGAPSGQWNLAWRLYAYRV